jgi:hypothetical protein
MDSAWGVYEKFLQDSIIKKHLLSYLTNP